MMNLEYVKAISKLALNNKMQIAIEDYNKGLIAANEYNEKLKEYKEEMK